MLSGVKILVVEDDPAIAAIVSNRLQQDGCRIVPASDGDAAMRRARAERPDLVVLDVQLPGKSGLDVCRELRADAELGWTPIVMLTALGDEIDRIVGFEVGADDYVPKPFNPRELSLRIAALLRRVRGGGVQPPGVRRIGTVAVDVGQRLVTLDGAPVRVTAKEFDLLAAFLDARGRALSRDHLLRTVWGYERGDIRTRTVDVHVRQLRRKLGAEGARIQTVERFGYRMDPGPRDPSLA
jgi:DNA-binding response OmpR family regulator